MSLGPRLVGCGNRLRCSGLDAGSGRFGRIEVDHRGSRVHLLLCHRTPRPSDRTRNQWRRRTVQHRHHTATPVYDFSSIRDCNVQPRGRRAARASNANQAGAPASAPGFAGRYTVRQNGSGGPVFITARM